MIRTLLAALLFLSICSEIYAQKPAIAVLDLAVGGDIDTSISGTISDEVRQQFLITGKFRLIDKNNMERILAEQPRRSTRLWRARPDCGLTIIINK
ncbi:MAG: hypothetical protein CO189_06655 [candidate division Zixibacteria bacterium CG_4_9_14_3_um_filter_46_8]|nr:MAG: hypothetical protein CO189_06655 [candidate division Zixibacteria bacterium CG_4_9_14_3_um_filter_46_8]